MPGQRRKAGAHMINVQNILFQAGSKEELLPGFTPDFPYIASRAALDKYPGRFVPWHWHRAVELFYMESGALEYETPGGKMLFPAGSGGMVNSNVLHMTRVAAPAKKNSQILHIFDPSLLSGETGSLIDRKYISPLVTAGQIEIIPLFPENPAQVEILKQIRWAFRFSDDKNATFGQEIRLREALSQIWLMLLEQIGPILLKTAEHRKDNDKIKLMMAYIHEHYGEKIAVPELAASAFLSERECFRTFHDCLHMTPAEYIKSYRLQAACRMLLAGQDSVTAIGHACGLGSSSYFGKVFREATGHTPSQYRLKWQNYDKKGLKIL